jgi:ABC-type cobalamin transport system permease subunit
MKGLRHGRRLSAILVRASGLVVFLAGTVLAAYAGVQWLQTAHWQPLTINGALASSPMTRDWIAHPHSWLGLHQVVVWTLRVPVFLIVTLLGVALLVLSDPLTRHPSRHDFD